jgi:hypothetical protein
VAVAAACLSTPAEPAEIAAEFSAGVAYSDNVNRVPVNGLDETIASVGTVLNIAEANRRVIADVRSEFTYYDYLDDTYKSELVSAVDALADLVLVEDRIRWFVQDNYGRALFDPFQPDRPENWENVNFLTTGPTIVLYPGERNNAGVDLRYSRMDYEVRDFDNERQGGRLWVGRSIRRDQMLSLNVDVETVEFDNGVTPDYDRQSAYLRWEIDGGRNLVDFDLGYTEQEILSEKADGIMFDLTWARDVSARSQLEFHVGRRFADQGNVFRYQQSITRDLDSVGDLTENGSPFLMESLDVNYTFTGERTTLFVVVGGIEQEYETQEEQDRRDMQVELFAERDLSRSFFSSVSLRYYMREFTNIVRDDDTTIAALTVGYRLSPALSLSLRYTYRSLESTAVANEFDENRGELTLTYFPEWGR